MSYMCGVQLYMKISFELQICYAGIGKGEVVMLMLFTFYFRCGIIILSIQLEVSNMSSENEKYFWKKKEFVSFILSILVLFIHSYFAQDIANDSFISAFNHKVSFFFSRSITQFAVPMFFMLSGISFFKEYDNKKYFRKIKSRLVTLVIPYLLWNTVWMIWEIFTSYISGEPVSMTLTDILKGIFLYGYNFPFWFLFNIIVFSFAAPIVFLIIRNKYVGIASAICLSIVSLFGIYLPTDLFYYPMSIVFYLIGAIIGYHFFNCISHKSTKPVQITSVVFLLVYVLAKTIIPKEWHISNYVIETVIYTLAAFAMWNIVDIFIEWIKPRAIYRRSFAIYAMHLNVAIIILKLLSFCVPQSEWLEFPKFIVMVVLTLVTINFACVLLERFFPKLYALFMGNRVKKRQQK